MEHKIMVHQMALALVTGVGTATAKNLIRLTGSVSGIFEEKSGILVKIPGITERIAKNMADEHIIRRAEEEINYMSQNNIRMIFFTDSDYPELLTHCQDAPIVLFVKGNLPARMQHSLSIIGTRKASSWGKRLTRDWVGRLSKSFKDLHIISGLAYGIDITGHEAALENNLKTIAVLGHGFHTIYPSEHRGAAERILEQGALITDFFSYNSREPKNFIRRNRIIAGITHATLVVESAYKGGAMTTAEMANSYNRDVFAVPGRPIDNQSIGCNYLIKNHQAVLVNSPHDIPYQLNWSPEKNNDQIKISKPEIPDDFPELQREIIQLLIEEDRSLDELCQNLHQLPGRLTGELLKLEFAGFIEIAPGNRFKLR